jgi:hypothetical protein
MFGHCLSSGRYLRHLLAAVLLVSLPRNLHATSTLTVPGGLAVAVDASVGTYQVSSQNPAWSFSGSLGMPLKNVVVTKTHDGIGTGRQISFEWRAGDLPMRGQIRLYEGKALALFSQTCRDPRRGGAAAGRLSGVHGISGRAARLQLRTSRVRAAPFRRQRNLHPLDAL